MKAKNPWIGTLCSKVAMSLLLAVISASSVSALDNNKKVKDAESKNVETAINTTTAVDNKKKDGKVTDNFRKWTNNNKKGNGTTGADVTTFQDGDDLWLTVTGVKLPEKPVKRGIYIHNGVKVTIQ